MHWSVYLDIIFFLGLPCYPSPVIISGRRFVNATEVGLTSIQRLWSYCGVHSGLYVSRSLKLNLEQILIPFAEGVNMLCCVFIQKVDRLFDILNSRSVKAHGFKQPLRLTSMEAVTPFLLDARSYLMSLRTVDATPLYTTRRYCALCWKLEFVIKLIVICGLDWVCVFTCIGLT